MIELATLHQILPSLWNLAMITLMAVIGITGGKLLFTVFPVPGFSTLFAAA